MATWDNVRLCLVPCEVCVSCQEGPPGSPSSPRSGPVGSGGSVDSCLAWKLQRDSSWGWWEFRWCLGCHNRIPQTSSTADIVSHSSGGWKSQTKVPAGWVSGETTFSLRPHVAFPLCLHPSCFFLFLRGHQSHWIRAPPLRPHLTLITSSKAPSANTGTLGARASTYDFGGHNSFHDRWEVQAT